jgi:GNAT superfamily N-acetyltransferase
LADNIRKAIRSDVQALVGMAFAMWHESPRYNKVGFDPNKMTWLLGHMIDNDECAVFVAEERGSLFGMIGVLTAPYFFSEERYACDLAVYVAPDRRGGTAGIRLVKAAEEWAESVGVREIQLGVSAGIDAERVGKLYEKLGYERATAGYVKPCAV